MFFLKEATTSGLIVDTREEATFKKGHLPCSINIQAVYEDSKFETWLGSIIEPEEAFTLVIDNEKSKDYILNRVAKICYEKQIKEVITLGNENLVENKVLDLNDFKSNPENYTIIDIRNTSEVEIEKFFKSAKSHPLNKLRESASSIPTDKPIVVHCAGGYRSAAGSSILEKQLKDVPLYDLSETVKNFK